MGANSLPDEAINEEARLNRLQFLSQLLEKVNQHNLHKPNPFGPPLPNQKCSKNKPPNQKLLPGESSNYCAKGFPKPLCKFNEEYIVQDPYRPNLYKLYLERNDKTLNNYNAIISLCTLANIDLQAVITYEGLIGYTTKYATKNDNPDVFRDFRDDTGKPVDAGANISRNEIPIQQQNIKKLVNKGFMDIPKYSMVSSLEMHHHLQNFPTHFTSRSFHNVSLQPSLNRLLTPSEINSNANQQVFVKDDEITLYEKRNTFSVSKPIIKKYGEHETKKYIDNMSLFIFSTYFYVRKELISKLKKPRIIIFKPYITPKKKNNPNYTQYMIFTL